MIGGVLQILGIYLKTGPTALYIRNQQIARATDAAAVRN